VYGKNVDDAEGLLMCRMIGANRSFLRAAVAVVLLSVVLSADGVFAESAKDMLRLSGVKGGLVVHLGCGDGSLTGQLRAGEQYFVHGLDVDIADVERARKDLIAGGLYGPVCVDRLAGGRLPYMDNLVNLIVAQDPSGVSTDEMLRVLAPDGVALVLRDGKWDRMVKPWPDEIDEWTHYLHDSDGNPVANDSLIGPPRRLQWVGSPRWSRHHDHMASMTSLVSAGGRLFYILDEGPTASIQLPSQWRLIARDAFNGVILWKRDIAQWNTSQYPLKSGPAHLLRRLVAIGDRVYVTLGIDAPVKVLDAATGSDIAEYKGSAHTREIVVNDGVVYCVADTSNSTLPDWVRKDTYVWANTQKANPGWGYKGDQRRILAYSTADGRLLWEFKSPVAPCSLAVKDNRAVFNDDQKLICLDTAKGSVVWKGDPEPVSLPVPTSTGPRVLIYKDVVVSASGGGTMSGWSLNDGAKLWQQRHRPSGHQSLKDLFVVEDLVWTGTIAASSDDGTFAGYDPVTGKLVKEFPADVDIHWFHHRCYPSKAAGKYLMTARNGTEYIDLDAQHWKANHWIRGGCIYGVMPCNGLTYAPMNSCGCQMEAKLTGFNALSASPVPQFSKESLSGSARLEKGPAYGRANGLDAAATDWPTYRHDAARSGSTPAAVSMDTGIGWQAKITGRLTAPVIAAGRVFVASVDTHTLHALDAGTGKSVWTYTTGGRIDSPPTYYRGLVLFGSADGYVYAVNSTDGVLSWRFRAAPVDQRMMAWEQLESAWPVHGSVLVYDGVLHCTAGRNMYVEGGLRLLRIDALTGKLLTETVMDDTDPVSGEDMQLTYLKQTQGNNMPVAHSDILSCDGKNLWMRSQKMTLDGKRVEIALTGVNEQNPEDFHIFCQNGFLDDTYFFRSYWTFGRRVTGGYGGWYQAGRLVPSGRILSFDNDRVYGFGRKPEYMVNSSVLEYQLFASDKVVTPEAIQHINSSERVINSRSNYKNGGSSDWLLRSFFPAKDLSAVKLYWKIDQPAVIARAMVAAGDAVYVAGYDDIIDERQAFRNPDDPDVQTQLKRQQALVEGKGGGQFWKLSKTDGTILARYALDTVPVFDGMAAATGNVYVSTTDGRVLCIGKGSPLKKITDAPVNVIWEKKEDPAYLPSELVSKAGDFSNVLRCDIFESKLGYRIEAKGKKQAGIAVNQLPKPITDDVTFRTRISAVPGGGGLSNAFIAFGDGPEDRKLIKCGLRLQAKSILIVQGPLLKGDQQTAKITVPEDGEIELVVRVDMQNSKVSCTAQGVTVEMPLQRPLKSITHLGYAVDSAVIDVRKIKIDSD
jgi:outer membrane protein assembly factor BamB